MRWKSIVQLVLWTVFSLGLSAILSLFGAMFVWVRTMDLHKEHSGPGAFSPVAREVILWDIAGNWAIALPFSALLIWVARSLAAELIQEHKTDFAGREIGLYLWLIFALSAAIVPVGAIYAGVSY